MNKLIVVFVLLAAFACAAFGQAADLQVDLNKAGDGAVIVKYTGSTANLVIPKELEGFPVKEIGPRAFADNKTIRELTLPDTLEAVGGEAFAGSSLTAITIPAGVERFGECIFGDAYKNGGTNPFEGPGLGANATLNLTRITFTGNRTNLPGDFFAGIRPPNGSEREWVQETLRRLNERLHDYNRREMTISFPKVTTIVFPPGLSTIPDNLCYGMASLTTVTIPAGVTKIGNSAFEETGLTAVTLPAGITEIGDRAFYHTKISSVTIPAGATKIGDYAFNETPLTRVTIPDSVTDLGMYVFLSCDKLTAVTLPKGLTTVGIGTFYRCTSLKTIALPAGVKVIGSQAFQESGLESITLPAGLEEIQDWAFQNCKDLKTIVFPDSITSLKFGRNAFEGCDSLSLAARAKLRQLGYTETEEQPQKNVWTGDK
jgi:hypothetical protein